MNKRLKIQEIESFDWPSMRGRIARHTFKPASSFDRELKMLLVVLAMVAAVAFLHFVILPFLVPASEARAGTDNAEYCKEWLQGEYANDYQPEIALICAKEL